MISVGNDTYDNWGIEFLKLAIRVRIKYFFQKEKGWTRAVGLFRKRRFFALT